MLIADIKTARGEYQITIDGLTYDLLSPVELSLRDHYEIGEAYTRMRSLQEVIQRQAPKKGRKEIEAFRSSVADAMQEIDDALAACLKPIMKKVPERIVARLPQMARLEIIQAYQSAMARERVEELVKAGEETGTKGPFPDGAASLPA
jgi:hypothetical protein